ncbi:hypothetical protein ACFZA2_10395 [Microbacterium sp. NPDC007973]|uniref:hypothetical protein n=1 Tax=Microbacterium sp. NPDC007973 TaxID=3364182 RepID=UPI0036E82349
MTRTLRETFGVGISDLGGAVSWGEARDLINEAAADPGTQLGAKLAGWAYPASIPQLLMLVAQTGKASKKVMPWALKTPRAEDQASPDEVAAAQASLEDGIVFAN